MWEVDNGTPFAHSWAFQKDAEGRTFWCVVLRATFALRDGRPPLFLGEQPEIRFSPLYVDDDPAKDFLGDADMGVPKARADLLIDAVAFPPAPHLNSRAPFLATAQCGKWAKSVQISPPATWSRWSGAVPVEGAPFTPVPLRYSQSFGGEGYEANPVGKGLYPGWKEANEQPVPRLSPEGVDYADATAPAPPAAFGPVAPAWMPRRQHAGTYDAAWQKRRAPLPPADMSARFFQSAPEDQQFDRAALEGAELVLTNMTSKDGKTAGPPLRVPLPKLDLALRTKFRGQWQDQELLLQSVEISLPEARLSMLYCAGLAVGAAQNDVLVERSILTLAGHAGFRVRPEDAHRFSGGTPALEDAA